MKVYIIRHGETRLNLQGILQGRLDEPLDGEGRRLAVITGQRMKGIHFDACYSSPLVRAKETAELVLRESGNHIPIQTDDRLLEISFGDREGTQMTKEEGALWFTDPFHFPAFPNGESTAEVCARTQAFLQELLLRDDGKTYLVATHGCALRGMLNFLYENSADYWHGHVPYNCAVNIVEAQGGEARLTGDDVIFYDSEDCVDCYKDIMCKT